MTPPQRQTLGKNVIPLHYALWFEPDFRTFQFSGKATIKVQIQKPTRKICLNAKELRIKSVTINQQAASIHQDDQRQEIALLFNQTLQGKAEIVLEFTGKHNDQMYGFYRSKYRVDGKGMNSKEINSKGIKSKDEYLVSTQFEAANARACFPCFDEPALKATFDVTLVIDKNFTALSNMPVKEEKVVNGNNRFNGKKQVVFSRSPKMSTYLLYLGVGNFKLLSTKLRDVTVRIFVTPDKLPLAKLPLHFTKTFLKFFEEYFQIPYPLPKLDIIGIPDFAHGAMENWGAITFRELALLGDENTSVAIKQQIALTIAHELAHQWFGNLVTMDWWEDLWLNESFATFMSYKAVNAAYPEWDLPLQYYSDTIADALNADQLDSTHPISVTVNTPAQVDEIFDRISYDKGGSILQMLESYVGQEIFQKGLQRYLKKHAYANAKKEDLWTAIQEEYEKAAGKKEGVGKEEEKGLRTKKENLTILMKSWIVQPGYPLVEVQTSMQKGKKGYSLGYSLAQQRFTLLGKKYSQSWLVPITYQAGNEQKKVMLKESTLTVTEPSDWIKLNLNENGFYRVRYPPELLAKIGTAIKEKKLSALDAAGVEDSLYALTAAGEVLVKEHLEFVRNYCLDAHYPLDTAISLHLSALHRFFYGKKLKRNLVDTIAQVSLLYHQRLLACLGWNRRKNEKNTDTMLRAITIASLGYLEHKATLRQSAELFQKIQKNKAVDANLRGVIYALAAWQGNEQTFSYLLEKYKQEKLPEESRKLLRALGVFKDVVLLKKALDLSQSSTVRLQDSLVLPLTVSANVYGSSLIWPWTRQNWPALLKKYSSGTHMLANFVHNLAGADSEELRKDIQQFFSQPENFREDINLALKQTLEKIEVNVKLMKRNG
ncbi:MAG: M1 family metallopeptidase [Nanoarchaeota archaeon]